MELWIKSQDKENLLKVDRVEAIGCQVWYIGQNKDKFLGIYKTKERALEVLDEIQDFISKMTDKDSYKIYPIYEMPKE